MGEYVGQEELPELFETLHMALFATMVVFIIEVVIMIFAGERQERHWNAAEEYSQSHERPLSPLS